MRLVEVGVGSGAANRRDRLADRDPRPPLDPARPLHTQEV
jgi:hypothetical protein